MTRFHPAEVVPGSTRVKTVTEVTTWSDGTAACTRTSTTTYITIRCSPCGFTFETYAADYHRTARCRSCNRLCAFDFAAARAVDAAPNVVPITGRRTS